MIEIRGVRATLRPTTPADFPDLLRLWNDGRVMRWVGFPGGLGYDRSKIVSWFQCRQADPYRHHYVMHTSERGFCGEAYYAVDLEHRRAGLDIKMLPEAQGNGIAIDALSKLISHIFSAEPEVQAGWSEPSEQNQAARRLYTRCGLKPHPRPADLGSGESDWELRKHE